VAWHPAQKHRKCQESREFGEFMRRILVILCRELRYNTESQSTSRGASQRHTRRHSGGQETAIRMVLGIGEGGERA